MKTFYVKIKTEKKWNKASEIFKQNNVKWNTGESSITRNPEATEIICTYEERGKILYYNNSLKNPIRKSLKKVKLKNLSNHLSKNN